MKVFRILGRNVRDAFKSVIRNFSLSIASITCITITLLLVSITIIISYNVNKFTKDIEKDLTVVVFVKKDVSNEDSENIKNKLEAIDNVEVSSIKYYTKEDVKNQMMEESDTFKAVLPQYDETNNPLLNMYELKVIEIREISKTVDKLQKLPEVSSVKYGEGMVDKLVGVFDVIKKASLVIVAALIIVTAFLISNTIKLTIFSRRNEIEIMRLVGTSNAVIRLPFLFEGLFLGIIGSIIPILATIYGYFIIFDNSKGKLVYDLVKLAKPSEFIFYLAIALVVLGGVVGMLGSYRAVRKYLKI